MFVPVQGEKETIYFVNLVLPVLTRLDGYAGLILKEMKRRCRPAAKKRTIIIGRDDGRVSVTCQDECWQQTVKITALRSLDSLVAETHRRILAACTNSNVVIKLDKKKAAKKVVAGKKAVKQPVHKPTKPNNPGGGPIADQAHKILLQACPEGETKRFRLANIIGKLNELDDSKTWTVIIVRWLVKAGYIEETGKRVGGKKEYWVNVTT